MTNTTLEQQLTVAVTENLTQEPLPLAIDLQNVSKWYGDGEDRKIIIDQIDLQVEQHPDGEILAVLGPSGSGKSTILNMISGAIKPDAGKVFTYGDRICGKDNRNSVTVNQAYTCMPWLTVAQNVEFGLKIRGIDKATRKATVAEYLEKVGLSDKADMRPSELSGGQKQRVACARTLALKPSLILMDEPFGALDAMIRADMQELVAQMKVTEKCCILFITHDISEAILLADRIIVLSSKPAHIIKDVVVPFPRPRPRDLVNTPEFVALNQELVNDLRADGSTGQIRVTL